MTPRLLILFLLASQAMGATYLRCQHVLRQFWSKFLRHVVRIAVGIAGHVSGLCAVKNPAIAYRANIGLNFDGIPVSESNPHGRSMRRVLAVGYGVVYGLLLVAQSSVAADPAAMVFTNQSLGTSYDFYTGNVGCKVIFDAPGTVTHIGRWVSVGDSGTVTVSVWDALQTLMESHSIDLTGATPGTYAWAQLDSPIAVTAVTELFVMSTEAAGGRLWYDATVSFDTNVVSAVVSAIGNPPSAGGGVSWHASGPVNVGYTAGALTRTNVLTYYLSPTGSDSNTGTNAAAPWQTYSNAVRNLQAGDTLLVQPGVYGVSNVNFEGNLRFVTSGTSNAPITLRANGPVTNLFSFEAVAPYYVFDGFTWDGATAVFARRPISGGSMQGPGSHHLTLTNCIVQHGVNLWMLFEDVPPDGTDKSPLLTSTNNLVINCTERWVTNGGGANFYGANDVMQGCVLDQLINAWGVVLLGSNNVARQCVFTNNQALDGAFTSQHSDIVMAFGDLGPVCTSNRFERNLVINSLVQSDLSMKSTAGATANTNINAWSLTLANNVWIDSSCQFSIEMPNVQFYNNTFVRCTSGLAFSWYDPDWDQFRGYINGGACLNNAWVDCEYSFSESSQGQNKAVLTNSAGVGKGYATLFLASHVFYATGSYSNLVGTVTNATIYADCGDIYTIDLTNFSGNSFSYSVPWANMGGCDTNAQENAYVNSIMGVRLNTTAGQGEVACYPRTYVSDKQGQIAAASRSNFVGTASQAKLAANGSPAVGSPLIDAGTNLSSLGITADFAGVARPQGSAFDIGAYEFTGAPAGLVVWFDFNTSTNYLPDMSGYGHDGWNFNTTNWITYSNGLGVFQYVGNIPAPDPYQNPFSQYAGVTNLTGLDHLTNATISIRAQFGANGDLVMELLDCGYYTTPNSWTLGRNSAPNIGFAIGGSGLNRIDFPTDVVRPGGGSPDLSTTNQHMYTVTVDGQNNSVVGYYDGLPFQTNTLGVSYLTVPDYLAIGAMQHAGTPQWDFPDSLPNAGFFVGTMDDVRIYNRTLAANEVVALYYGTNAAPPAPDTNAPSGTAPSISTQPTGGSILVGGSKTFTVTATGDSPLAYQWRFNGGNLSGATATGYTVSNAQTNNAGDYSVVVSNSAGSVTSSNARLTVNVSEPRQTSGKKLLIKHKK